jgi:hypothetical protein
MMTDHLARSIQLQLQLVDHQMVDRDGWLCGNIDDLELEIPDDGSTPYVSAILSGPAALAPRLQGRLGGWVSRLHRRLHPATDPGPIRIPWSRVADVGSHVRLSDQREELYTNSTEAWLAEHFIGRIPGGRRAPQ